MSPLFIGRDYSINDRQTDRQVAFIDRDYSRKYLKMRLMVGEAEGVKPGHVQFV